MEEPEIELRLSELRPGVSAVSSACTVPYASPPLLSWSEPYSPVPGGDTVGNPCPLSSVSTWLGLGSGFGFEFGLSFGLALGLGLGPG